MKFSSQRALACATTAARAAGRLMRREKTAAKKINQQSQHDIKLELDVLCQKLIEKTLLRSFPQAAVLGEEGVSGPQDAEFRWVVDPIDGTVNFAYGVPHACVSIAWQQQSGAGEFSTVAGVVYDPFCDELWTAARGGPARLNGKVIHVSRRKELAEAMVSIGFSKSLESLNENLPVFNALVPRVRKIRMMGAAALALVDAGARLTLLKDVPVVRDTRLGIGDLMQNGTIRVFAGAMAMGAGLVMTVANYLIVFQK